MQFKACSILSNFSDICFCLDGNLDTLLYDWSNQIFISLQFCLKEPPAPHCRKICKHHCLRHVSILWVVCLRSSPKPPKKLPSNIHLHPGIRKRNECLVCSSGKYKDLSANDTFVLKKKMKILCDIEF